MTNQFRQQYFDWICNWLIPDKRKKGDYVILLSSLFQQEFTYINAMDGNRYADGLELRYFYGSENNIPQAIVANELDIYKCSVLEMIAALVLRCEKTIFNTPIPRYSIWFWDILKSLEMDHMSDYVFDYEEYSYKVNRFLNREYLPNGRGGLFTLANPPKDLRQVEIWYQAMWYFDVILKEEGIL